MKEKVYYNLIATDTVAPVPLDSATTTTFGPIQTNDHASTGRIYLSYGNFATATGDMTPSLYGSWNGFDWFVHTAFPTSSTAYNDMTEFATLPRFFRLGYTLAAERLEYARAILEADAEY